VSVFLGSKKTHHYYLIFICMNMEIHLSCNIILSSIAYVVRVFQSTSSYKHHSRTITLENKKRVWHWNNLDYYIRKRKTRSLNLCYLCFPSRWPPPSCPSLLTGLISFSLKVTSNKQERTSSACGRCSALVRI
jgi:hypothetical protein